MNNERTHIDLFSGIGGFSLAASWAGVKTIGFSEIDDYASKVLAKNFPGVTNYGDIRNVPAIDNVWLITGGFPCQPFSVAGKREGANDDRWLWPEMAGVIERIRPTWVLAENVTGIVNMELDSVLSDLERLGYSAWPIVIPAVAIDAKHRRDRVWIVGNASGSGLDRDDRWRAGTQFANGRSDVPDSTGERLERATRKIVQGNLGRFTEGSSNVSDTDSAGLEGRSEHRERAIERTAWKSGGTDSADGELESRLGRVAYGLPAWLDESGVSLWEPEPNIPRVALGVKNRKDRLKGLGNAIVPQVAYQLICTMIEAEENT